MDKLFKVVKQDGAFFFVLVILNLPILLQAFVGNFELLPSAEKFFTYAREFFCVTTIIFILTCAIHFGLAKKKKLKKFLQRLLIVLFAVAFVAEFFYLSRFREDFGIDAAEILLENLFEPEVFIGAAAFAVLLFIGIQDLQKIFKSMSTKKIKRITYALLTIFLCTVVFSVL